MFWKKKNNQENVIYRGLESWYKVLIVDGKYANILIPGDSCEYPPTTKIVELFVASKLYEIEWDSDRLMCESGPAKLGVIVHVDIDPTKIIDALRALHYSYGKGHVEFDFSQYRTQIAHITREWCSDVTETYLNQNRTELASHIKNSIENKLNAIGFIVRDVFIVQDLTYGINKK